MNDDLPKQYNPDLVENKWYDFWERKGVFHADALSDAPPFSIILPPPNVTGILHMGHALGGTLQDMLTRYYRMSGFKAVWIPGTDHAGIATQTVVERHLMETQGKRRTDFSREAFLKHAWKWKEDHEKRVIDQLKTLGCSCDWLRQRFTMDPDANLAVRTLFKKMFDDGLIYQGDYLVNWDPVTQTALADDEVEYEERETHLWYFNYPFEEGEGHLTIATTRPETLLGDVAVAVSPKDERYKDYIGKRVLLPIVNRSMPIIADPFVDKEFGTGVVKITPAHDPNDYEIALRHDLPMINLLNPDGTLNENGLEYEGLTMEEARRHIVARMKEIGFLSEIKPHTNRVGLSYRSKAVIEPYLSKQWFVKMAPFKEKLIDAVKSGKVKLVPKSWEKTYFHWIENLRDWCISRQLWWGHRIPVWKHKEDPSKIICYEGEGKPEEVNKEPLMWEQDPDVLDTWFSSALWPFSALGWPHKTNELKAFYPNSVLLTGHDILFFWVARMIMMGEYVMGTVPFKEVSLQGLIYGKSYWREKEGYVLPEEKKSYDLGTPPPKDVHSKWEKMSKSKGNVIDPIEVINSYGADAMRMALAASATESRQIDLDRRRFEEFKNFANKVWNGSRFVMMNLELSSEELSEGIELDALTLEDRWILSRLSHVTTEIQESFKTFHFDRIANHAYTFFWDEFCSYYVEISKPYLFGKAGTPETKKNKQKILVATLLSALRLMHPVAPFITEEIFHLLKGRFPSLHAKGKDPYTDDLVAALSKEACAVAPFPTPLTPVDPKIESTFKEVQEVIYTVRNIRAEMGIPPGTPTQLMIIGESNLIEANQDILKALLPIREIQINPPRSDNAFESHAQLGDTEIIIPLPEELREKELLRLKKEKEKTEKQIEGIKGRLSNPNFADKAPKEVVDEAKAQLTKLEKKLAEIEKRTQ